MTKLFAPAFLLLFLFSVNIFSAVKTWDGGGNNTNWSTAANWVGDVAPVANDSIVFPATAAQFSSNNDLSFNTFASLTFEGGNYTLGGLATRLTGGITVNGGTQTLNAVTILNSQTFTAAQGSTVTVAVLSSNGSNVNSYVLKMEGAGSFGVGAVTGIFYIEKNGLGSSLIAGGFNYNGLLALNDGIMIVDANLPTSFVRVNGGSIDGNYNFSGFGGTGTVGVTDVIGGVISAGTLTSPTGTLTTGNLSFYSNGVYACKIVSPGTNTVDRLNVVGTINIFDGILLPIPLPNSTIAVGDVFVILRNDGTEPVNGTFLNAPEGAIIGGALNTAFRITYHGGDGNDVVITRVNRAKFDFEGDGKADVSVFRPSDGTWYELMSSNNSLSVTNFGVATDKIVPADYDGDSKTDVAVFRDGYWYYLRSTDSTFNFTAFGTVGDVPVPNDFDGDGRADFAVFRPSTGSWYQLRSAGNQFFAAQFGQNGDLPQVGDFDGDGLGDLAVFRAGNWYLTLSATNTFSAISFGIATDKPVPADYDGDGKTDVAVYRDGYWYLNQSTAGFSAVSFGIATDKPVPADYDGDGKADVAVYRDGNWYRLRSTAGFDAVSFGSTGDKPIPSAFQ